jgi:glycosyltransferase involved in cell wall biosynthesis
MRVGIDARKIADFGIGTYIRGLLTALVELEPADRYVAFAPAGTTLPAGVEHVVVDAPHYSLRELLIIGRAADRAGLDLFHAPHYVVPATRVPVVVTIHDLIHLHQPLRNPLARLYARTMLRRAVRNARCVLTVTETVREQLERELGARNVVVTPNGVDLRPSGSTHREPCTFLFAGNDKPHKNVGTLVEAFRDVRRTRADAVLVLAGAPFERFRGGAGIVNAGFVAEEELLRLYRSATALVLPSLEEGFGLPAAEAMALGTPVITSTAPALVEVTADAALHAEPRDARAFASAMLRVASDAALRATMSARGLEIARAMTWKRCAEATRKAFHDLL